MYFLKEVVNNYSMENIFQNYPKGIGKMFEHSLFEVEKTQKGNDENPFMYGEKEPVIVFEQSFLKDRRRINDVDNTLLFEESGNKKRGKRESSFPIDNIFEKSYRRNKLLKKFFPKLYGRKILKAVNKRIELIEENTKEENTKHIPFGENEKRYNALAQNLSEINYLQSKLNKEIK